MKGRTEKGIFCFFLCCFILEVDTLKSTFRMNILLSTVSGTWNMKKINFLDG